MTHAEIAERYAQRVQRGELTLEEAAEQVSGETGGDLTPYGAKDLIQNPAEASRVRDLDSNRRTSRLEIPRLLPWETKPQSPTNPSTRSRTS